MQLFYAPTISFESFLDENDSKHCIKVLRKKKNDTLNLVDGKGTFYEAIITDDHPKKCQFQVTNKYQETAPQRQVHIAIAPTKNSDRIEWFIEKCVEIGISKISLLKTQNSERKIQKIERLEKIAISAMKQALKATLPIIEEVSNFQDFIKQQHNSSKFIAHLSEDAVELKQCNLSENCIVLIGPEGDFSEEEVKLAVSTGFQQISLGNSRLRTETAGVVACTLLSVAY